MAEKSEIVRCLATALFRCETKIVTALFTKAIQAAQPPLSPLSLSQQEYDSGDWAIPVEYQSLVTRVIRGATRNSRYKITEGQIRFALLQSTRDSSGLIVSGVAVVDERAEARWTRGSSKRWTHGPRHYRGAKPITSTRQT